MDHYSASQIKTFRLCPRKWWYQKISNVEQAPPHPAAALGSRVHEIIEDYLENSDPTSRRYVTSLKEWKIAEPGLKHWPVVSKDDYEVEEEISIEPKNGFPPVIGRIDLLVFTRDGLDVEIIDHKTVGNWSYASTSETLLNDLQMNIYAKYVVNKWPDVQSIRLTHLQYGTKGAPKCQRVSVLSTRENIDRIWKGALSTMEEMEKFSKKESAKAVSIDVSGCSAFGGCQFDAICRPLRRTFESFNKNKGDNMSSLQDLLNKRNNKPQPEPETEPDFSPTAFKKAVDIFLSNEPKTVAEARALLAPVFETKKLRIDRIKRVVELTSGIAKIDGESIIWSRTEVAEPCSDHSTELVVLIDCLPITGDKVTTFERLLQPIINKFPVDPLLMDFGKGQAQVSSELDVPESGILVVDSRNPYWAKCMPKILVGAKTVIRGVR